MGYGIKIVRSFQQGALASIVLAVATSAAFAACSPTSVELRGDWGQARFNVEIADDVAERAQGLMNRESMPMSAGMLFVYEQPQRAQFWMKNTLIPLDMIFIDQTGTVTHVHSNAIPRDLTPIDGGDGVFSVLEINGGLADSMGIAPGTQVRNPNFSQESAVWPCEAP